MQFNGGVRFCNEMVIPPFKFGLVEERLYRSAYPTLKNFRLNLKTVVSIVPEKPYDDIVMYCGDQNIDIIHIGAEKYKQEGLTISAVQVAQIITLLVDPRNSPVLLHCLDGGALSGTVIMCLRKLQAWSWSSTLDEFNRYMRTGHLTKEIEKFAQDFSEEICIGFQVPKWLWGGAREYIHPFIRLKHDPPLEEKRESSGPPIQNSYEENEKAFVQARGDNMRWRHSQMLKGILQSDFSSTSRLPVQNSLRVDFEKDSPNRDQSGSIKASPMPSDNSENNKTVREPKRIVAFSRALNALALEGLDPSPTLNDDLVEKLQEAGNKHGASLVKRPQSPVHVIE